MNWTSASAAGPGISTRDCFPGIEIGQRKLTEQKLQDQLARLNLLSQITSAIGERQI